MNIERAGVLEVFNEAVDNLPTGLKRWYQLCDLPVDQQLMRAQFDYKAFMVICPEAKNDFYKPLTKKRIASQVQSDPGFSTFDYTKVVDSVNFVVDELARAGYLVNRIRGERKSPVGKNATFLFKVGEHQLRKLAILRMEYAASLERSFMLMQTQTKK